MKVYDTERAEKLASWNNKLFGSFNYMEEELYRKKTGKFFLNGSGGAKTKYAEVVEMNVWSGREKILPFSYEETCNWVEEFLPANEYESIFGYIEDDIVN